MANNNLSNGGIKKINKPLPKPSMKTSQQNPRPVKFDLDKKEQLRKIQAGKDKK
jgi:hypothetical protein